jgi:predicted GNAT superfamily acetyltransferase
MSSPVRDVRAQATVVPTVNVGSGGVHVRHLESLDDFEACVALQKAIWGADFDALVPTSLLQAAAHIGGLVIGAFAADALVGFVLGLTGVRDGEIVHWSHMLGVRREAREMGIGRQLKELQRSTLAARSITRVLWTFDPLQARNAHLNINRLGVRVTEYVVNMYGTTRSPLHFGIATDRLIVESCTAPTPRRIQVSSAILAKPLPVLTPLPRLGDCGLNGDLPNFALIEIPVDVQQVADESADAMNLWRVATREHLQWALRHGYLIAALHRDLAESRAFYLIARDAREVPTLSKDRS